MVPSLTRQIRQVREMTVFFLRPKESGGPPSLASSVSSVPKGLAPQGERPERTSLPPHAEAGMPEAAPPDFVTSGQESAEVLRNLRRRLFTPATGTSAGRIAAQAPAPAGKKRRPLPAQVLFSGPRQPRRARRPLPHARRKGFRGRRRTRRRKRLFRPRGGRSAALHDALRGVVSFPPAQKGHNELPMFLQRLSGFRRAGNTNPARWTGGPVSARSRKDARRAWFSVLRACVPA